LIAPFTLFGRLHGATRRYQSGEVDYDGHISRRACFAPPLDIVVVLRHLMAGLFGQKGARR
jgi:hypothetical protein